MVPHAKTSDLSLVSAKWASLPAWQMEGVGFRKMESLLHIAAAGTGTHGPSALQPGSRPDAGDPPGCLKKQQRLGRP